MIKKINILLVHILSFVYINTYAAITTNDCNTHKVDVIKNAAAATILTDEEYVFLDKIIMESCINNIIKADNNTKNYDGNKDWFTEKILSGDKSKKDGNKRLRKLK